MEKIKQYEKEIHKQTLGSIVKSWRMINFPEGMKNLYNDIQNDNEWQMLSDAIWLNKLPNDLCRGL